MILLGTRSATTASAMGPSSQASATRSSRQRLSRSSNKSARLPESNSEEATRKNLREFYKMAIPADSIARAIAYAIEQPAEVDIDEVVIRPTAQDF
jgi:NADP-dependent 3-hydroxy acid dehydrogenase YdfG